MKKKLIHNISFWLCSLLIMSTSSITAQGNYSVSGAIDYSGPQVGDLIIRAWPVNAENKTLKLDGSGDYIKTDLTDLSGTEITIQYWFKGVSNQSAVRIQNGGSWIVAGWNGKHILQNDDGVNGVSIGDSYNDGEWHHITLSWKKNTEGGFASYVDGELVSSRNSSDNDIPNHEAPVYIGAFNGLGEFTSGSLDEVVIWSRALSAEEIKTNWNKKLTGEEDGIIAFWDFESEEELLDLGPNAYESEYGGDAKVESDDIPKMSEDFVQSNFQNTDSYILKNVKAGNNYRVFSFIDVNGNNVADLNEPFGEFGELIDISKDMVNINIKLKEAPIITEEPKSVKKPLGETISLNVKVAGTEPMEFVWRFNNEDIEESDRITGTRSETLTINDFRKLDEGIYTVVVENEIGSIESSGTKVEEFIEGFKISGVVTYNGEIDKNSVLSLDGDGDYVKTPLTNLSGDELTIQYWFRGDSLQSAVRQQSSGWIVAGWNGKHILQNDEGVNGVNIGEDVLDGKWHHVTLTWKRNTELGFSSYVDGNLVESRDSSDVPIPDYKTNVYFGSFNGVGEFTNGQLDEIAIWNRALSAEEVKKSYKIQYTGEESGLIGYWNFEDGGAKDLSGNNYDGELNGDAKIIEAVGVGGRGLVHVNVSAKKVGNSALVLDGDGDFVETTLTDLSGSELSIQYWFKGDSNQSAVRQQGGPGWIVAGWSGQHILFNDGGTSGVSIGPDYNDGEWHHITMTWKQNTENGFSSYVDGKLITARNSSNTPIPNIGAPIQFGAFLGKYEFAKGQLDEIAIWNRALSFGEISSQWNTVLSGSENGIVGYWNFDNGSATDLSENEFNGELKGDAIIQIADIPNLGGVPTRTIIETYNGEIDKNSVLSLDGDGDYVKTPLTNLSGDELTIQYWFRGDSLQSAVRQQSSGWIVAGWNGKHILQNDEGVNGVNIGEDVLDGKWHHVTLTWKRNTELGFSSYVDGNLVESRDSSDVPIPDYKTNVYFGSFNGVGEFTNGQLDEIAIWNRALSAEEVKKSYKIQYTGEESGLIGYWNFEDGGAKDLSGNNYDGELNGDAKIIEAVGIRGLPGKYELLNVIAGEDYVIESFVDLNGDGKKSPAEPFSISQPFNINEEISELNIELLDPVQITMQPNSISVAKNEDMKFSVDVIGTGPFTFQWFKNGKELVDNDRIFGADTDSIIIKNIELSDSGVYSVVVSNTISEIKSDGALGTTISDNINEGLIAHWKLNGDDEDIFTAFDSSDNLLDAELMEYLEGDPEWWLDGKIGNALDFNNEIKQFAKVVGYENGSNALTISAWVLARSTESWGTVLKNWGDTKSGHFHFGLNSSGELSNFIGTSNGKTYSATEKQKFPINSWQHIATTVDGLSIKLYRNGELVAENRYQGTLIENDLSSIGIGAKLNDDGTWVSQSAGGYWNGKFDDIGLWSRSLDHGEILGIYEAGIAGDDLSKADYVEIIDVPSDVALSINELGNSKLEVTWYDKSNKYFLQSSTDLINWFNLDAQSTDSNGEKSLVIEKDQNMLFLRLYHK